MYLLDHLVGKLEHALLNGEAHLAGNRLVDDQLEAGRLHDRQIGRLGAFQDAIDLICNKRVHLLLRHSVAREAPRGGHLAPFADCRDGMPAQERRFALPARPPAARDFVPWRFSYACRRRTWIGWSCRRPKTYTGPDSCDATSARKKKGSCGREIVELSPATCLLSKARAFST